MTPTFCNVVLIKKTSIAGFYSNMEQGNYFSINLVGLIIYQSLGVAYRYSLQQQPSVSL